MADYIYVGTVGLPILIDAQESIVDASSIKINVRKPNGVEVEWTGAVFNTRYVKYTTTVGDLNVAGKYHLWTKIVLETGEILYLRTVELLVYDEYRGVA